VSGEDWLNAATRVVLPTAVAVIMFCLGLGLKGADFARTFRQPRLLAAALLCQLILLPLVAFAVARLLSLSIPLAAGLVLIACCPASAPASLLARLAGANVAASIATTALTVPATAVSIPLALRLTGYWNASGAVTHAPLWGISASVATLVTLPVLIGMTVHAMAPVKIRKIEAAAVRVALVAFAVGLALAVASCRAEIPGSFRSAGIAAVSLNAIGVITTHAFARLVRVDTSERIVLALGSTTRQFAVAAFVALTLLRDEELMPPAIAYCLVMWLAPAAGVWRARSRSAALVAPTQA
jgi:bile acid:Na+ symporter, BASS family